MPGHGEAECTVTMLPIFTALQVQHKDNAQTHGITAHLIMPQAHLSRRADLLRRQVLRQAGESVSTGHHSVAQPPAPRRPDATTAEKF